MKIRLMTAEIFHAHELINMVKLILALRNFVNESKNGIEAIFFLHFDTVFQIVI
jgi:hypothetical protein